jgi:transcriptional regulator with XRE-family HTH domain
MRGRDERANALQIALGEAVRRRRQARDLSQEELAHLSGLHRTYVSDLERGLKAASLRALVGLSHALKVAPSVLISEAEEIARG